MNRNEEYKALLSELDALPVPEGSAARAVRRARRAGRLRRTVTAAAAAAAVFVGLVNFSPAAAEACAAVPVLRELARAVQWNKSLSAAVKNDYVQPVELEQTKGDIRVRVEYLIVDRRQVNVFYRVWSNRYAQVAAEPDFYLTGSEGGVPSAAWGGGGWGEPRGDLWQAHLGFSDSDVPPTLGLRLRIRALDDREAGSAPARPTTAPGEREPAGESEYLEVFDFELEFDPFYREQGKHVDLEQTLELDGQTLLFTAADVYPSHMELTVSGAADNTAWLAGLQFRLVTDRGEEFSSGSGGILSFGGDKENGAVRYWAESPFFYRADAVTVVVTGAEWLDKDREKISLDLENAQADFMPQGARLLGTDRTADGWVIRVERRDDGMAQTFLCGWDPQGERRDFSWMSWTHGGGGAVEESIPLEDYPWGTVELSPRYTRRWADEEGVKATLPLR